MKLIMTNDISPDSSVPNRFPDLGTNVQALHGMRLTSLRKLLKAVRLGHAKQRGFSGRDTKAVDKEGLEGTRSGSGGGCEDWSGYTSL